MQIINLIDETVVRQKRAKLLLESDFTQMPDYPISEQKREEWRVYRQCLRDLTSQPGYPEGLIWPTKPGP